jgi:hypothetical protein
MPLRGKSGHARVVDRVAASGAKPAAHQRDGLGRSWRALVRIIRKRVNRSARSARSPATALRTELDQDDRRVANSIVRDVGAGRANAIVCGSVLSRALRAPIDQR